MQRCFRAAASQQGRWANPRAGEYHLGQHLLWNTAAQQPVGFLAASTQLPRGFHSDDAHSEGLYEALGVERTASKQQIKEAFRQKAKKHHPDRHHSDRHHPDRHHPDRHHPDRRHPLAEPSAAPGADEAAAAFARILTAYQILTSDRQRELYNLQLDSRMGRLIREDLDFDSDRQAAGESMEWAWGLQGLTRTTGEPGPRDTALDRLRDELRGELRSSLRLAYLGPKLNTAAGQLPGAFEMDERSHAAASDEVLQLVSGRQLLGVVRVRSSRSLPKPSPRPQPLPGLSNKTLPAPGSNSAINAGDSAHLGSFHAASPARNDGSPDEQHSQTGTRWHEPPVPRVSSEPSPMRDSTLFEGRLRAESPPSMRPNPFRLGDSGPSRDGRSEFRESTQQDGHVAALELVVGDMVVAVGIQRPRRGGQPLTEVYNSGGDLVAREAGGYIMRPGAGSKHSILRAITPLVRHLQFMYTSPGGKPVCLARLKRAWLPPAATWLFPPRTDTHAVGGWYVEWCGHSAAGKPAYLDPSVMIIMAAFDTLSREQQKAGHAGGLSAAGDDNNAPGYPSQRPDRDGRPGILAWLKSMFAFHGKV